MKKRSVTKLLSCVLAISMVVTAAPMTAWASEVPTVAEEASEEVPDEVEEAKQEDAEVTEGEGGQEAPQETEGVVSEDAPQIEGEAEDEAPEVMAAEENAVPEAEKAGRSVAIDGKHDAWAQDTQTVIGDDALMEMYNGYLHFKAGTRNGNSVSDANGYPAMFVNPSTFDFTKDGYFEYEIFQGSTNDNTRFGVYLDYTNPAHGLFLGYDKGGWYWQKYNGDDNPYQPSGVACPGQSKWTKVKVEWTADGKFSMTVGGNKVFENEPNGMTLGKEGKIAIKCGGFNGNVTDVYLNNIFYEGQEKVEGNHITGKVIDEGGNPVSGVKLESGRYSAETAADGTYDLEVLDGTYNITVSKKGYISESIRVVVEGENVTADDIVICSQSEFATMDLNTDDMKVVVAKDFPSIVRYEMKKGDLAGKTFYGQVNRLVNFKINGVSCKVTKDNLKTTFTNTSATYEMALKGQNIDCVITAVITVKDNTASFDITKVENNLKDLDENGYQLYPVQTIEVPDHSLISVNSKQANAHLKGAKMSSNTRISGDRDFDVVKGMKLTNNAATEDFIYGFISNNEMSAGLWSNSEYEGTHVASYISSGGASNTRVLATVTDSEDASTLGLASTQWYYDRKVTTNVVVDRVAVDGKNQNTTEQRTYVVEHEIMPSAKVAIAGDANGDGDIDWQDGAVEFRSIMHNPYKSEEVPELVNYRIAMNFGSHAANPFLMNLDGVKRVYLNTEGLGQGVLLKGYGSEGHDSGHPDYGDIGRRIGGADDMNTLMVEGKKMGALFGIHVNASEMYAEAKAFSNELSQGNFGWNWLDQGIGINSRYDLATGAREARFKELYDQVGNNLDFIYVDVWGNHTSGGENEDSWATRMLFREISGLGWRVATEWGPTGEYDSTLQHWAADLAYGGNAAKGENSAVMRFLRNHQKDSWIADYPSYHGAAQSPLLGGLNMTDFEGWQGRTNYKNYINVMFRHNLITKYLQHYQVVDWVDGEAVTLPTDERESWTPEMQITLRNTKDAADNSEVVVSRKSNDYTNLRDFRSRTITLNGVTISEGAPTGGDGSNVGDEKYLIPWNWDCNGNKLAADDLKMYHWNTAGGTSTWTLTKDWQGLSNVVVYKLTDAGRTDKKVVNVVDNTITLEDMEREIPYVIFKGEKAPLEVDWQTSKYVYDMGFNDQDVDSHRTVTGPGTAEIVDNSSANHMLKLEGDVTVSTKLTNLRKGQKYALYVGTDNRSDSKAHVTVTSAGGKVLGTNYTEQSYAFNYVKSDQHNTNTHTVAGQQSYSRFQNLYVFFTAEGSTATLTFKREAGAGATYFDDIRVVETKMDVALETNEDGIITSFFNDFEENAQGLYPFVVGSAEGVEDNRVHLSERHDPYTSKGYISKSVDDVLDGNWSLKVNGLSQKNRMVYQTIPQNFHFQPGQTYYVSFDYQMGSNRVYEVRLGDGNDNNVRSWSLAGTPGETKRFGFSFTASESGQNWFGIYSTSIAPQTGGYSGSMLDFSGYKDFVLDNVKIEKGVMDIDQDYVERTSAEEPIYLHAEFTDRWVSPGTKMVWKSSDESVARVDENGTVYFVGFGTSVISANATVDGVEYSASCVVHLKDTYEDSATSTGVWANTDQGGGEGKNNVVDGDANTIWHSNWSYGFTVSEDNPAIITVGFQQDVSGYDTIAFQQRPSNSNGVVKKYECIVGDTFDEATHTITGTDGQNRFTTGVKNTKQTGNGKIEDLELPEGTKGHYLQIRVLEGGGNFASIAEILVKTQRSYDTPEERAFMAENAEIFAPKDLAEAKDQLTSAISNAQDVYSAGESLYSNATWTVFAEAYEAARQAEKTGTLEEIRETKAALEAAQDNLKLLTETGKELDNARKALKAAIDQVKPAYEAGRGDYSTQSWEAFEDAYTEARLGLESESISKVNRLATALLAAHGGLKTPDETLPSEDEKELAEARKNLNDAIAEAEAVTRGDYSDETWEAFEEALVAARAGLDSASVTKLNRLEQDLKDAQQALKKAETPEPSETEKQLEAARKALNDTIAAAKAVYDAGQKDYSNATWEAFESAYNEAKAGVDSSSKAQLDRLAETLAAAKNNLKPADKNEPSEIEKELEAARAALDTAITAAKAVYDAGQKDYSNATWEAFESAYNEAKAGVDSGSKAQLDRLKAALISAQDSLKGDEEPSEDEKKLQEAKKTLKAAIDAAKKTYEAGNKDYTDTSWEEFEAYYVRAARAYEKTASYSKMNRYAKELTAAQKGLEKNAKVGDTFTVKKIRYKVTSTSKKTVAVVKGTDKNATSASIASTVEFRDVTFKVTSISAKAFKGFKKLKKVTIGAYVQTIKSEAFAGCTNLAQVSIGKRVSTIDKKAFYGCKKLKKVVFLGTAIKNIKTQAFKNTSASMKVTLPQRASAKKRASVKKIMRKAGMSTKATVK